MSIKATSGINKLLNEFEGIGSTLLGFHDPMEGVSEATSGFTRSFNLMPTDDEVNHRPAAWQQAVCTP